MGFFDDLGKAAANTADAISKSVNKTQLRVKQGEDIRIVKLNCLHKLSQEDLVELFKRSYMSVISSAVSGLSGEKGINPHKMSKVQLVEYLANNMEPTQIQDCLRLIGKGDLAEKLKIEVDGINKRYQKGFDKIDEKETAETNEIDKLYVNEIAEILKTLLQQSIERKEKYNERSYETQAKICLIASIPHLEEKFNQAVQIGEQVLTSPQTGEKIDLTVSIGNFRVGIEMKKVAEATSTSQRLLGQIDRYLELCHGMIILIVDGECDSTTIKQIQVKAKNSGKVIRIVTPTTVY